MREVLDLYREILSTGRISCQKLDRVYLKLALAFDRAVVNNRPSQELKALCDEVLYIKSQMYE